MRIDVFVPRRGRGFGAAASGHGAQIGGHVAFVHDFAAEQLFHDVLKGDDARESAVFVEHGEEVLMPFQKFGEHLVEGERFEHEVYGLHDFAELHAAFVGVAVQHPEIPQPPRWSAIERLNIEKSLIGIFLSAHPLDEYEYEVREMCDITAAELTLFDGWRTPDARAAAAKNSENENANYEDNENNANNVVTCLPPISLNTKI